MGRDNWSTEGKSRLTRNKPKRNSGKQQELVGSTRTKSRGKSAAPEDDTRSAAKRQVKDRGMSLLTLLVIILILGSIYIGFKMTDNLLAVDEETLLVDEKKQEEPVVAGPVKKDVLTVLVLGIDQREKEAARADTAILAMFDRKTKEMHLFSLPRDTKLTIPGKNGTEKLGHAYAYGGGNLAKQTVEQLLNISIDGYISTNFRGFANMVDIIGGIELEVEARMLYEPEDIDLYPGKQLLNGEDALAYVRYRSDGRGDIGRMERQQKFLKILAKHLLSVSNVLQIPSLVKEFNNNVKTDMGVLDMVSVANLLKNIDVGSINAQILPGEPVWISQVSYWQPNLKQAEKIMEEILYEPEEEKKD